MNKEETVGEDKIKQVIVMRKDLNMRKGKMIAQGSHASMLFLVHKLKSAQDFGGNFEYLELSGEEEHWLFNGRFYKICVGANSEEELLELLAAAETAGLTVKKVVDAGFTEFNGVPTFTCIAIGPDKASRIDPITGHLTLL